MGMFSFQCRGCGHPMLSRGATNKINGWMKNVVAITEDGGKYNGEYDGYGRVDGPYGNDEDDLTMGADWWHFACWTHSGKPGYKGPAKPARDQGWFFNDPAHNMPEPKSAQDVKNGRGLSEKSERDIAEKWQSALKSSKQKRGSIVDEKTRIKIAKELLRMARVASGNIRDFTDKPFPETEDGESAKLIKQNPQLQSVARRLINAPGVSNISDMLTVVLMAMKLKGMAVSDVNRAFTLMRPMLKKII